MKSLRLNKVKISKINNLNTILGGGTGDTLPPANSVNCRTNGCDNDDTGTNNDPTSGEVTGINPGRTDTMTMG